MATLCKRTLVNCAPLARVFGFQPGGYHDNSGSMLGTSRITHTVSVSGLRSCRDKFRRCMPEKLAAPEERIYAGVIDDTRCRDLLTQAP